jgi:hypothetical protein
MAKAAIRPIRIEGNVAYVPLTRGYEALIDVEDVPLVEGANWHARVVLRANGTVRAVYAATTDRPSKKMVLMHRRLLIISEGMEIDHIDGDGLNNRRGNLREATRAQNMHNSRLGTRNISGVKGITWHRKRKKWVARIAQRDKKIHIGLFDDLDVAIARMAEVRGQHHGQFARQK